MCKGQKVAAPQRGKGRVGGGLTSAYLHTKKLRFLAETLYYYHRHAVFDRETRLSKCPPPFIPRGVYPVFNAAIVNIIVLYPVSDVALLCVQIESALKYVFTRRTKKV